jgi:soluble cytochrome b562
MLSIFSACRRVFSRVILLVALVSLFNLVGWSISLNQPSYAAVSSSKEALRDIQKDMQEINPEQAYEKATEGGQDPKMEVQKKYEENLQEYYEENPEKSGILGGAKELINRVTADEK